MRLTVALNALLMLAAPAFAGVPQIDRIFPLGAQRGATTEIRLSGKPGGALQAWSDCEGLSFQFSDKFDTVAVSVPQDAMPGRWSLRFFNNEGATKLFPFVVGSLPETNEVEPNNRHAAAQKCAADLVVNGVLAKAGDVDTYAVPLQRGQTFVASMHAHRLGSPMDGVLQLLSPDGTVLTQNDEGNGFDPQIIFPVSADGDYLVRTFAFPAKPNSSIRYSGAATYAYRLTLTTGPVANHVLPMVAQRGKTKAVKVIGWNLPDNATADVVQSPEPNWVRLNASTARGLELPMVPHDSFVENALDVVRDLPFSVSGTILQSSEVDSVRFKATKGTLQVTVIAQSVYSPLDPVLVIRSADGKLVKELDDISRSNRDIRAQVNLPADGEYSAELRDRFAHGGMRYVYSLTCERPAPDFSVTAAANALTITKGKSLEIPLKIERTSGFAEEVSISVQGLPEGIVASVVKSEPKKPSAKAVKLVLKSEGNKPFSGPIRLQCQSPSGTLRFATASTGTGFPATSLFWLTCVP